MITPTRNKEAACRGADNAQRESRPSPEEVFAYVTDPVKFAEWQEAVVSASRIDRGPMQQGSRSR
jgi:hypothetical protein